MPPKKNVRRAEVDAPALVDITMAHPLTARYCANLGIEVDPGTDPDATIADVHDIVSVSADAARSLIAAGYAQVDPEDPASVAAALHVDPTHVEGQQAPHAVDPQV